MSVVFMAQGTSEPPVLLVYFAFTAGWRVQVSEPGSVSAWSGQSLETWSFPLTAPHFTSVVRCLPCTDGRARLLCRAGHHWGCAPP